MYICLMNFASWTGWSFRCYGLPTDIKSGISAHTTFVLATQQPSWPVHLEMHMHGLRGHLVQNQQVFGQE